MNLFSAKIVPNQRWNKKSTKENLSVVYANGAVLRDVCLTILAENQIFFNQAKWDEIRKENSKGNNEYEPKHWAQKTALQLTLITLNGVSTLQQKQSRRTGNQHNFGNKITLIIASLENNQPFYSIADFFSSLYDVWWAKSFISGGKIQRFITYDWSKMISLLDFYADSGYFVRDRKILPVPGANRIAGFSGCRPISNREKINGNLLVPLMIYSFPSVYGPKMAFNICTNRISPSLDTYDVEIF